MSDSFESLCQALKSLPGLGGRSAQRLALHLVVESPDSASELLTHLQQSLETLGPCTRCGNIADDTVCRICLDESREASQICVVESVSDLFAMERSEVYRGRYHVLRGKLSPLKGVLPEHLNFVPLAERIQSGAVDEIILALSNDIEGEATCHYIMDQLVGDRSVQVTRIGFGLPSGGGVVYADSQTLKSALEARRKLD